MRPVLLELDGFASYRTPATIDFSDADFFVLVGPTGSGKSTVIDAMVFALYGTVPRWDDRAAVAPALAPTATRGVVRLIFDVGGQRYVALRDVRRSGGKTQSVSVKEARLERYVESSALGEADDQSVPIATGRAVSGAVENLLGLNFDQFTQSVALPQGEFARFLHATDADRQAILKNLLGYTIYDQIQRAAYSRSAEAKSKAATLDEQLLELADATDEQVDELSVAADALRKLQEHVTTVAIPALKTASDAAALARSSLERLTAERTLLTGITKPDGVDELDAERRNRDAELVTAEQAQRAIENREQELRAGLQGTTQRHELERRLERWSELKRLEEQLPGLTLAASEAGGVLQSTDEARTAAEAAAASARDTANQAAQVAADAGAKVSAIETDLAKVRAIEEPEGIQALGDRLVNAKDILQTANTTLAEKEEEQRAAASAVEVLPAADVLAAAKSAAEDLNTVVVLDDEEVVARDALDEAVRQARTAAEATLTKRMAAEKALHDAEHADRAAALRSELRVGDECPVCGHEIVEVPSEASGVDLQTFRDAVRLARANAEQTADDLAKSTASQQSSEAVRAERMERCEALRSALVRHLSVLGLAELPALSEELSARSVGPLGDVSSAAASVLAAVVRLIDKRASAETRRRDGDSALASARDTVRSAAYGVEKSTAESRTALAALNSARDGVSSLGPPPVDDTAVAASWHELTRWAGEMSRTLAQQLTTLAGAAEESRRFAARLNDAMEEAEAAARKSNEEFTNASVERQKANSARDTAQGRIAELTGILSDAPTQDETVVELERVKALEAQLSEVAVEISAARESTKAAQEAVALAENAITTSQQQLRRMRDPLAQYGAPELAGTDLAKDWDLTIAWASAEADARSAQIAAQEQVIGEAEARLTAAATAVTEELANQGVEVDDDLSPIALADRAPTAVATSVAAAEAALARAKERRSQSEKMRMEMEKAQESANVAQMLSQLMRAQNFPRWLIASALDTLLRDASAILLELSGGQFELTRNEQDLLVIDHNDADMSRLVKTLSGGETFQASLALALALSEQVTALSTAGASKLESIFLDEGFGTLDEATLDVVAGTLENLASSGSRMVGVITHVPALAERIPVRFEVDRDNAGSHIERVAV